LSGSTVQPCERLLSARLGLAAAFVVSAILLLWPTQASAQIPPATWGDRDYCSDRSAPAGKFVQPDPVNILNLAPGGSGSGQLAAAMYGTLAECMSPANPVCSPQCSNIQVMTVCEFHCQHDHTPPFHWTVQIVPTGLSGHSFVGWNPDLPCEPILAVPRHYCVVRMSTDRNATARFSPVPDAVPPAPFTASVSAATSYTVTINWSSSSDDQWLGGYEVVHSGSVRMARLRPTTTTYRAENLNCNRTYTFRVEAYDTVNTTPSNDVQITTGACIAGSKPVPNTIIHVKPPRSTRSRTAFFHYGFRGALRATRYQCKLDRGRWKACSGSRGITYRRLKRGYHTFYVRAGNANGFDRTPARWRWRIR
jgi:hypothetical protein